jgi:hypothetical protein
MNALIILGASAGIGAFTAALAILLGIGSPGAVVAIGVGAAGLFAAVAASWYSIRKAAVSADLSDIAGHLPS